MVESATYKERGLKMKKSLDVFLLFLDFKRFLFFLFENKWNLFHQLIYIVLFSYFHADMGQGAGRKSRIRGRGCGRNVVSSPSALVNSQSLERSPTTPTSTPGAIILDTTSPTL